MGGFGGFLRRFWRNCSGISASEYAMLTAVVAIGGIIAIGQLSGSVSGTMDKVAFCLDGTISPSSCK